MTNAPDPGPDIVAIAREARAASHRIASASARTRAKILRALYIAIVDAEEEILEANAQDMHEARACGLPEPKLQRLELSPEKLEQMRIGLDQIEAMPDPVGAITAERTTDNGLRIRRVRTPLGVICMIYEARPGVTIDAFALCLKAGNACVLKGGREAVRSNTVLARLARESLASQKLPTGAIQLITTSDREHLRTLLRQRESIDLVIPRGGEPLIRFVAENSTIPTIQHYHGVCHIYIDADADIDMARRIALVSKTSAPATCNAAECLLVHESIAKDFLPAFSADAKNAGIELRADPLALRYLPGATPAQPSDFGAEFLDLIYAVKVVASIDEAIAHIHTYGSDHTDAIVTDDPAASKRFTNDVRSSCVMVNAGTRFNDGFQLGLGAEIGISTTRIHAYGPMGAEHLTIERTIVEGSGQVR